MGRHLLGMGAEPAFARCSFTVLFDMPVLRHDVRRGQSNDLRLSGADDHRGDSGMIIEGLAIAEPTGETVLAMNDLGRKVVGAIEGHEQLIAKASDETRRKLERERPEMTPAIDAFVADVTASLHAKFGPATPRYYAAKKAVSIKHRLGELQEKSILEYARARKMEETIVGLTLLCSLPSDVVERALAGKSRDLLLIIAKAHEFSWDTTMALLFLGAPHYTISSHELDDLKDQFTRLHVSSSKDVLSHYRNRRLKVADPPQRSR